MAGFINNMMQDEEISVGQNKGTVITTSLRTEGRVLADTCEDCIPSFNEFTRAPGSFFSKDISSVPPEYVSRIYRTSRGCSFCCLKAHDTTLGAS